MNKTFIAIGLIVAASSAYAEKPADGDTFDDIVAICKDVFPEGGELLLGCIKAGQKSADNEKQRQQEIRRQKQEWAAYERENARLRAQQAEANRLHQEALRRQSYNESMDRVQQSLDNMSRMRRRGHPSSTTYCDPDRRGGYSCTTR